LDRTKIKLLRYDRGEDHQSGLKSGSEIVLGQQGTGGVGYIILAASTRPNWAACRHASARQAYICSAHSFLRETQPCERASCCQGRCQIRNFDEFNASEFCI